MVGGRQGRQLGEFKLCSNYLMQILSDRASQIHVLFLVPTPPPLHLVARASVPLHILP